MTRRIEPLAEILDRACVAIDSVQREIGTLGRPWGKEQLAALARARCHAGELSAALAVVQSRVQPRSMGRQNRSGK